ncbi:MAG TPA: cupin domain-containing protein [Acetobacteraceae bacterium]|nr:cupin domain-containing protein [Acetobacteraceae bacterium]
MIRCVRIWTGEDGNSHFEEGTIAFSAGARGDRVTAAVSAVNVSFQETESGGSYAWHQDPVPRLVITLGGTLEFETRGGGKFVIRPGDILLAEDNSGTGHRWKLIGDEPWRRVYVVYQPGAALPFKAAAKS